MTNRKSVAYNITLNAILIALVLVATMFIQFRLPISVNGGLIHLGNVALFLAAIVFGKKRGAIAGAFGMGLFDVLSGWTAWAPYTFIIRGVMGYVIGMIAEKKQGKSIWLNLFAVIIGGIIMIVGYYFAEVILYANFITPLSSIPGNLLQIVLSSIIGLPLIAILKKNKQIQQYTNR